MGLGMVKSVVFLLMVFLVQCIVSSSSRNVLHRVPAATVSAIAVISFTRAAVVAAVEEEFDDATAATSESVAQADEKGHESSSDHDHEEHAKSEAEEPGFWERMFPENHHLDTLDQLKKQPIVLILVAAFIVKYFLSWKKMDHIEGSLVRHVNSVADWNVLMDESKSSGKYVVTDFYATWCPPCRQAAPKFDQMSIEYGESGNVIFCKVDVDKVESVAKSCGIQAMPTFMLVKDAKEVRTRAHGVLYMR